MVPEDTNNPELPPLPFAWEHLPWKVFSTLQLQGSLIASWQTLHLEKVADILVSLSYACANIFFFYLPKKADNSFYLI